MASPLGHDRVVMTIDWQRAISIKFCLSTRRRAPKAIYPKGAKVHPPSFPTGRSALLWLPSAAGLSPFQTRPSLPESVRKGHHSHAIATIASVDKRYGYIRTAHRA